MSRAARHPAPRPGVLDIAPYVPGRSEAAGGATLHKLSSNETPLGPSPAAVAAYHKAGERLHLYPDGAASALRKAICGAYGLNPERIVCGVGSDEILHLIAQAYLGPGDEAIHSQYGFLIYPIATRGAGGTPVVAPERDFTADVDAILERVNARTRIVYLANPNNPTGTYVPFEEVRRLHAALPGHVLLVLDAAYAEYVRRNDYESGLELAATADNVVMTRTLSKIYGLAGLRIGWGYGPAHVIDALNRVRGPFNMSSPAIAAGAAAIGDRAHMDKAVAHNDRWLPEVTRRIGELGLTVTPSIGNFVLIRFPDAAGRRAADADAFLLQRGVVVRRLEPYGLANALRMTIGTAEANEATIAGLGDFLTGEKAAAE